MTKDVFLTILRQVLIALGALFGTKFGIDGETVGAIIGGVVAIAAAVWGIVTKSKDVSKVAAANTVLETASTPVSNSQIAKAAAKVQE